MYSNDFLRALDLAIDRSVVEKHPYPPNGTPTEVDDVDRARFEYRDKLVEHIAERVARICETF